MTAPALLGDLARHLGIPTPVLDAREACGLCFGGDLTVELQLELAAGEVRLAALLGQADADELHGVLVGALLANLAQSEVGRPHFGYLPQDRSLTLCRNLPLEGLDGATLAAALNDLAEATRAARSQLGAQRLVH